MAASAAATLLDELMGRNRNLAPSDKTHETYWDDPEVCRYYLVAFCPHELFVNTRADLGPCEKLHDDELREKYKKSSRFERMGYEEEFHRFCQNLLSDVERRIARGYQRLALNAQQLITPGQTETHKQVEELSLKINVYVDKAETLGCEGNVEEAKQMMTHVEKLRDERNKLESLTIERIPNEENIKKMEVCNVCGALLVAGDAQQRIDEHIMGKQHMGYARIRSFIEGRRLGRREIEDLDEIISRERAERMRDRDRLKEEEKRKEEGMLMPEETQEIVPEISDKNHEPERKKHKRSRSKSRDRERHRRSRSRDRESRSRRTDSRSKSSKKSKEYERDRDRDGRRRDDKDRSHREKHGEREGRKSKDNEKSSSRDKHRESHRDDRYSKSKHNSKNHRSHSHSPEPNGLKSDIDHCEELNDISLPDDDYPTKKARIDEDDGTVFLPDDDEVNCPTEDLFENDL